MNEPIYYNLTHAQKRIWYVEKMNPGLVIHNIGGSLRIEGKIDVSKLDKAIQLIIKHNDGLRLRFRERNEEAVQHVDEYQEENIDFVDFTEKEDKLEQFNRWIEGVFTTPFELIDGKLYYFGIYKLSDTEYGVLLNIHHLIADGWSIHLIEKQLCNYYKALEQEQDVTHLYNESYVDYIQTEKTYLNSSRFLKNKQYWNVKFEILPETMITKRIGDPKGIRKSFKLGINESAKIRKFVSKQKQLSLATFFTALKIIYLHKTKSIDDIILGVPVFNRIGQNEKNTVGMFTSSVPLRVTCKPGMSGIDVLTAVNKELRACLVHQQYPYDLLVNDLHVRKAGYDTLFDICVNYYNTKYSNELGDIPVRVEEYYSGYQSYSLQMVVKEWLDNDEIELLIDYRISDYSDIEVERMYNQMMHLANRLIENGEEHIENLSLGHEEHLMSVFDTLNQTKADYPREKTVMDVIEEQILAQPNAMALVFQESFLTYGEMNQRINQLAHHLENKGVFKGDRVAIIATHSYELVIGILATLKVGAAYVPIDPKYPLERIEYMLQDSDAKVLYTNIEIEGLSYNQELIMADDTSIENEDTNYVSKAAPEDIAYIIYTSGSTGKPKGVMIEHRGLMNYIWWAGKAYLKDEKEVFALYSSITFDLTITSIFTPLLSGQLIAIYEDKGEEFILYKVLEDKKATVIKVTPAHLTLIKDQPNHSSSVKRFIVGGENLPVKLAKEAFDSFGGKVEIYNEYGPTETVVGCMIYQYRPEYDLGYSVPIGKPADNVEIYLFDKNLQLVTPGIVGELYIAGDGVARGYLNKEELTKNVFIHLNNERFQNKRMYKTGDLGKMLPDGNIEYIGRADNQVKLRGFRIELGEIESAIRDIDFVKEGIVQVKKDFNGQDAICAYIVSDNDFSEHAIKQQLFKKLPACMVPSYYVNIEQVPLTSNGKVDYKQLPGILVHPVEFISSRNETERQFIQILEGVMGKGNLSMNSNFFQIGGDSIKAIQIVSKLKDIGMTLKVQDIMEKETLEDIALCIDYQYVSSRISQNLEEGKIRNTPIIQWFLEQRMAEPHYFNQSVLLEFKEKVGIENIQVALREIIHHHDTLRVNFDTNTQELYYNNQLLEQEIEIEYFNLNALDHDKPVVIEEKIKEISEKVKGSITLDQGFLIRACVITVNEKTELLLLTGHHLVIDGVSWRIILEDFLTLLTQIQNHQNLELPLKTHSFKEWASILHEYSNLGFPDEVEYWKEILNHPSYLSKDFDKPIGLVEDSVTLSYELDEKITKDLGIKINQYYNMDLNELLISSLALTIHKTSNMEEVVFEVERHGREQINEEIDISRTIGWFTSIYPVHFKVKGNDLITQLKELKEIYRKVPYKGFNFSVLKYINKIFENIHHEPIRFNYLGDFDHVLQSDVCKLSSLHTGSDVSAKNKLTALVDVMAIKLNGKLQINITFSSNTFENETMQSFLDSYINIIKDIYQHCSTSGEIEFTPSDFNEADLSEEDLELLFLN
ncbi:amino acid adenylation domain-containing protein [Lysinibacillus sp. JNUCC 51]|uniref:amino acid adenylation domain-containing protein n=1 Tax=Lysinibacillus sp. JNUCC-51 TaxID=2792479 RepID=UPI00193776D2|nr:amino acid adenylation domain-containing protein [Lysinibacillus sp. JNUCC-51]